MTTSAEKYKMPLMVLGAIFAIWGILGWLDAGNIAQGGWAEDGNNGVVHVIPGGPADQAGLQVGDVIQSTGGVSREDLDANIKRGRPAIGETWDFVVDRDGQTVTVPVTFGEMVTERKLTFHASFIAGICFLFFGLRPYLSRQNDATMALATTGVLLSMVFFNGPYFDSAMLRSITNSIGALFIFVGIASLLYFLMQYPKRSSFLDKSNAKLMLFAPGVLVGLFLTYLNLGRPTLTDAMNTFTNVFIGIVVAFYFLGSIVTIYKSYSGASDEEKDASGLKLMMIGTVLGLAPAGIATAINVFAPQVFLPGQQFYFLALILIPITWSMAVSKGS